MFENYTDDMKVELAYGQMDWLRPMRGTSRYNVALESFNSIMKGGYKCNESELTELIQLTCKYKSKCKATQESRDTREKLAELCRIYRSRKDG